MEAARLYSEAAEESKAAAKVSEDKAKVSEENAEISERNALLSENAAADSATDAETAKDEAADYAALAHSWAKVEADEDVYPDRTDERANNAWFWSEQARIYAGRASGGVTFIGNIPFANLPQDPEFGDQYNVTDDFTTDGRFNEGAGIFVSGGTDIIYGQNGKWNLSAPTGVASFGGRKGNVVPQNGDYTPDMVGAQANTLRINNGFIAMDYSKLY